MSDFDGVQFVKSVTTRPGIYQMLDAAGVVLYVGKAKNLKKRLTQYFSRATDSKTSALVAKVDRVEVTITNDEVDALVLEANLIKALRPHYNILLKDDKSYPYVAFSGHPEYPRLDIHRGSKEKGAKYYGPYPNAGAAREAVQLLQKFFQLRPCRDSVFQNRSRPCLQHQIGRCSAPCVGLVSPRQYAEQLQQAELFLSGKSAALIDHLKEKMTTASKSTAYEEAAAYRDKLQQLRAIHDRESSEGVAEDCDVIGVAVGENLACVSLLMIRAGRTLGSKPYYFKRITALSNESLLLAFLSQYYLSGLHTKDLPARLLTPTSIDSSAAFELAINQISQQKVRLQHRVRGRAAKWLALAKTNAEATLQSRLTVNLKWAERFEALQEALQAEFPIERIECFDISHTMGEATVASCVVFDKTGPVKSDFRIYNIKDVTPGDDYAAMRQSLWKRFSPKKNELTESRPLPQLLIIDGGKGQLQQAIDVLDEVSISEVLLLGVAKGPARKSGLETLYFNMPSHSLSINETSPARRLIEAVRDEAHRFAITKHRKKRAARRTQSSLLDIEGVGPKRKKALLTHFGGLQALKKASVDSLAKVPGVSKVLAEKIFDALHQLR